MTDFDEADIAAMRAEPGRAGFREFLRHQIDEGRTRHARPPDPPPRPPGPPPGTWPPGCRPRPAPCTWDDWQAHLADNTDLRTRREQDPT